MNKQLRGIPALEQPTIYRIVGEHRSDPDRLLLLGADGQYYTLNIADRHAKTSRIVPDDDWITDLPSKPPETEPSAQRRFA